MWMLIKKTLLALIIGRTFGGVLALLVAVLAPLAGLLKLIGIPVIIVMLVVAAPVILLLAVVGLPLMLVAIAGVVIMGVLSMVLALSVALLKVLIPIAIVFFVLRFLWRLIFGKRDSLDTPPPPPATGTAPETL
jgi:hypothetical protein